MKTTKSHIGTKTKFMLQKELKCGVIVLTFLGLLRVGTVSAQVDCASIQCDCENIPSVEMDAGLKDLCKHYEQSIRDNCEDGDPNPGSCDPIASGPNAWDKEGSTSPTVSTEDDDKPELPPVIIPKRDTVKVEIPDVSSIEEIRYCNQLKAYIEEKGYQFGHVSVNLSDSREKHYFKEAWAYDLEGSIYVVVAISKKAVSGFTYRLAKQYGNRGDYDLFVYCNVSQKNWKKFSNVCNDCDLDERYSKLIKASSCDCL